MSSTAARNVKVAVAMSGGIDSSVSAYLLKSEGYDVTGVFMKNWDASDEAEGHSTCTIDRDRNDWREVCQRLDIPAVEVEFIKEYWNDVFVPMLDSYQSGAQTPNPDVVCNRRIKFDHFRKFVFDNLQVGAMATGHYARVTAPLDRDSPVQLLRGLDARKDQSYFLSMTPGTGLSDVLFPVGHLPKERVKAIGQVQFQGLSVLTKPESMGLCFVGKRDMRSFLGEYLSLTPGRFVCLETGEVLGSHQGKEQFTEGQGAKISGARDKYFVTFAARGGAEPGDVNVVRGSQHPRLFSRACTVRSADMSWIAGAPPTWDWSQPEVHHHLSCKPRYNIQPVSCSVRMQQQGVVIEFATPVRAVTPGQVLALYHGDVCLGGGIITTTIWASEEQSL